MSKVEKEEMKNLTLKLNLPFSFTISVWIQKVDRVLGINSRIGKREDDKHILLWDFDNKNLLGVKLSLMGIQSKYGLSNIYIIGGDKKNSYKAICFDKYPFWLMIGILYDTLDIDQSFYRWTVRKGQATMRIGKKRGRINLNVIDCIYSKNRIQPEIPEVLNFVKYETPIGEYLKVEQNKN
jgi:hypothetical protein